MSMILRTPYSLNGTVFSTKNNVRPLKKCILQDVPHERWQILTPVPFILLLNLLIIGLHLQLQMLSLIASKFPDVSLGHLHVY